MQYAPAVPILKAPEDLPIIVVGGFERHSCWLLPSVTRRGGLGLPLSAIERGEHRPTRAHSGSTSSARRRFKKWGTDGAAA